MLRNKMYVCIYC